MRIALIAPPWLPVPPPAYGGLEAVLDGLARGLDAAGHDVLLYATGDSTCPVARHWVVPKAVGTAAVGVAAETQQVINAYEAAVAWRADVIHDHTLVGPVYAHRPPVPVVTTNHGPFDADLGDLYRRISGHVPIVAISRDQASHAQGIDIAAVIHHGVDPTAFPEGPGDGGYALFLGRMNPDKGVDVAVRTARAAGVQLKIAAKLAEASEIEYFERQVEPLLGDGIEFVGEVGGTDKLDLLGRAQCLLNPIRWAEPFGMVMIEALACGTPVVATPVGSVPEIVDDGSTGFIRSSEADLVAALARVADLDRAECRREVATRFSLERMAADHLALYDELIQAHAARGDRRAAT